jgi:alanyl-tRNA synthetase
MRDLAQVELRHGAPSRSSSVAITVAHPAEPGKAERITIGPVRGAAALIGGVPPARDLWQAAGMQAREIRRAYLDMLVAHGHVIIPRAPLVLRDDPTTLFTGSGMQPLLKYLLGADHPSGSRLGDVQPCLRAQDMNDVGDNRHTTFFEMLGNWSLGDYSKSVQIPMLWHFLTDLVGLPPERIYVSAFIGDPEHGIPRDEESAEIWTDLFRAAGISHERVDLGTEEHGNEVGNQGARIAFYGHKNWWSRGGGPDEMPVGDPGGPDSEVFFHFPQVPHDTRFGRFPHQNSDGGQYLEIGNSVFMQYRKTETGFAELPRHNVDFGGGLERIAAASIDNPDVYRIDRLWPIVQALESMSGKTYDEATVAMRVVTDHLRGAALLAADGVMPGNKTQSYVMRRLVRRGLRYALELDLTGGLAEKLVPVVAEIYKDVYPEIGDHGDHIIAVLSKEERTFARTLRKGLGQMRRRAKDGTALSGQDVFELHDRFGMPVELCVEEAGRMGTALRPTWQAEYDDLMDGQRNRSHEARAAAQA